MGPDLAARRLADLDELNRLHNAIEGVTDLNALKPIFYRLEEITRLYPDDAAIHLFQDAVMHDCDNAPANNALATITGQERL